MGTQPALYVFDYRTYQERIVPALREIMAGRPAPASLRPIIERFATRFPAATPFRFPKTGHCKYLATQSLGCYCLRADLGQEPDLCALRPGSAPPKTDLGCGLWAGMDHWFSDETDFVDLFNGLVGANCLFHEHWLSRDMYLWDMRIDDDNQIANDEWVWIGKCTEFIARSRPYFLALYRRGLHLGRHVDPGGLRGWLTPTEVVAFEAILANDLPPPPVARADINEDYEAWYNYHIYDDLRAIETMCRLAATRQAGLAASYSSLLYQCAWATIHV
jgi:hypothetical protein